MRSAHLVPLLPEVQLVPVALGVQRQVALAEGLPGGQVQEQSARRQGRVEAEHALVFVHLQSNTDVMAPVQQSMVYMSHSEPAA